MKMKILKIGFIFTIVTGSFVFFVIFHSVNAQNQSAPVITSILPATIHYSDEVDILGTGFGGDGMTNGSIVFIEGTTQGQKIISWTDTKIRVSVNNAPLGEIRLKVGARDANSQLVYSNAYPIIIEGSCKTDVWTCSDFGACQQTGTQTRTCTKTFECDVVDTPMPYTSLQCTYVPPVVSPPPAPAPQPSPAPAPAPIPQTICTEDIWSCTEWNSCSASGIQTRSCRRTFDCPAAETPPPETSQMCRAPLTQPPFQSQPDISENPQSLSQSLIKATVKLLCPVDSTSFSQGSGTVIDSTGTILTNRHVVEGTIGCVVGFINDPSDEPDFSAVAFVMRISTDEDIALLKIDNKNRQTYTFVNVYNGDARSLRLGDRVRILGYPDYAQSGASNLTYTSGEFGGFGSRGEGLKNYLKTTAALEHGNSGGGAYTSNNTFIGIPTLVIRGELNSLSYILSVNKIIEWLNSTSASISSNQQRTGLTVSALTDMINDSEDAGAPDLSETRVIIYGDKTKRQILPNSPGQRQTKKRPTFQISGVYDSNGIEGYYVYFGTDINADPEKKGRFVKKTSFTPRRIKRKGVYYFIFKAEDKEGNISDSFITEYRYKR